MDRPYLFADLTNSICSTCLQKVEAKILYEDDCVFMQKWCPEHRGERVLISTDIPYYKQTRSFLKPGQLPKKFNTPIKYGCPYDCGLCPDHEQHSCLSLIEITDLCNLTCPVCYSESGPHRPKHRSMEQIRFMLDCVVRNEGEPDVVQISGGEPTTHPQFFEILREAKSRPIKHLMLNTNGVKIARDEEFAKRLTEFNPGFEVYLQFDSLRKDALVELRGEDLRDVRMRALEHLNRYDISTTLVVVVKKDVNDDEIGDILQFASTQDCVRGVTFQPVQSAGRLQAFDPAKHRLTLSDIRKGIIKQFPTFRPEDVLPVPCHPDCLAMAYAMKVPGPGGTKLVPLTSLIDPELLLSGEGNTIVYETNSALRAELFKTFSTNHSPESASHALKDLLCCLPRVQTAADVSYKSIFRVIIMQFLDPYNFDVRSVKRSCVHIVHPDGRLIPFDTYNLFYRDEKEKQLEAIRSRYLPREHFAAS